MTSLRQHTEAERLAEETGMGFIQALRAVQMRDTLMRRTPSRRYTDNFDGMIAASWKD